MIYGFVRREDIPNHYDDTETEVWTPTEDPADVMRPDSEFVLATTGREARQILNSRTATGVPALDEIFTRVDLHITSDDLIHVQANYTHKPYKDFPIAEDDQSIIDTMATWLSADPKRGLIVPEYVYRRNSAQFRARKLTAANYDGTNRRVYFSPSIVKRIASAEQTRVARYRKEQAAYDRESAIAAAASAVSELADKCGDKLIRLMIDEAMPSPNFVAWYHFHFVHSGTHTYRFYAALDALEGLVAMAKRFGGKRFHLRLPALRECCEHILAEQEKLKAFIARPDEVACWKDYEIANGRRVFTPEEVRTRFKELTRFARRILKEFAKYGPPTPVTEPAAEAAAQAS